MLRMLLFVFTFQYVYIKTMLGLFPVDASHGFTFQYVYIKTLPATILSYQGPRTRFLSIGT